MLDEIHDVDDYSEITIRAMIDRLERSTSLEHFVYRETELDEMWRVVDLLLMVAEGAERRVLVDLRAAIMQAHDLVGVDAKPLEAAQRLRELKL